MIFEYDDKAIPEFAGVERIQCPNCRYLYPVKSVFIDYQELYKREHDAFEKMHRAFDNFCLEAAEEVPEFKIYLNNKNVEFINILKDITDMLKNNYGFGD